ncbi:MAG: hypothetical protein KC983_01325, partial [Phycisphaerales bacterium]|nr:hypothetical protein [Phycisphaerales bacterium]
MSRITLLQAPRARGLLASLLGVICIGGVAALSVGDATAPAPVPASAPKNIAPTLDKDSIALRLSVRDVDVMNLDVPEQLTAIMMVRVPIDGVDRDIALRPYSIRAAGFEVREQLPDGSWRQADPGPVRTVRGEVLDFPGSTVAGSITDDGLTAMVIMPDASRRFIEPMLGLMPGARRSEHAVYSDVDVIAPMGHCGTLHQGALDALDLDEDMLVGGGGGGPLSCTELACDADVEFSNIWGGVTGTQNRIETVINAMNAQYESQVQITHLITTILVRTNEPDPYSSSESGTLLGQFRTEWLNNQTDVTRDVAKLFTGKQVNGSTIGQAWTIGGICTTSAYCHSQNSFNGSFACSTDLAAHELGHLWNASHCSCPSNTMNPSITCANNFTQGSINSIVSHRNSRTCLTLCDGAEDGTTTLPFMDDFESGSLNPTLWTGIDGAVVDTVGVNEPSGSFSLRINGSDEVRSARMDTDGAFSVTVSYAWQRTGGGDSPENNENLIVEYRTNLFTWAQIASHPGNGSDTAPYTFESFQLPPDAYHSNFRLRFRGISTNVTGCGGQGCDDFFVDNVGIDVIAIPTGDTCLFSPPVNSGANPFTNVGASTEGETETCGNFESDVWVRYVTECEGVLTVSICDADFDTELAIYGVLCPTTPDQAIACSADDCGTGSMLSIPVGMNELYRFRIGSVGGVWGSGTLVVSCDPVLPSVGACCLADGSCFVDTAAVCSGSGGAYEGDDTICSPNPCPQPTGACCMIDGSCVTASDADCTTMSGNYQGDGSSCSPNMCPQPATGACCFADGSCSEVTGTDCLNAGGTYSGDETDCAPNNCPQPVVCPTDCAPDNGDGTFGNGIVNIDDLLSVINDFGANGGPCDNTPDNGDGTFGNGIVNIDD